MLVISKKAAQNRSLIKLAGRGLLPNGTFWILPPRFMTLTK